MSIGSNIRNLRVSRGMSQSELARKIGVTDKAISSWENGKKFPRMGAIEKMSSIFGVKKSAIIEDNIVLSSSSGDSFNLTEHERELIVAYRQQPSMQSAVDRLLGIEPEEVEQKKQA